MHEKSKFKGGKRELQSKTGITYPIIDDATLNWELLTSCRLIEASLGVSIWF